MAITGGFGITLCTDSGMTRRWYMGHDGVKRWADNGKPVEKYQREPKHDRRIARGDDFAGDAWLDTENMQIAYTAVGYNPNESA